MASLENLAPEHLQSFRQALENLLATDVAEFTYALIIDGLPTQKVYSEAHRWNLEGLPILSQPQLSEGTIERIRRFRADFEILSLQFPPYKHIRTLHQARLLSSCDYWNFWQLLVIKSQCFSTILMRALTNTQSTLSAMIQDIPADMSWELKKVPPLTPFFNHCYRDYDQYPNSVSDVVGYWAETRIFGGVVLFDRGETDEECDGMYLHSDRRNSPYTIFPPTETQFENLVDFLLSPTADPSRCPLPITCTADNKWRWEPYEAMAYYHIFRDRYERKLPEDYRYSDVQSARNWPEVNDRYIDFQQQMAKREELPVDEDAWKAAKDNLRKITPSSPAWYWEKPERMEKKMLGKPPYFFDPFSEIRKIKENLDILLVNNILLSRQNIDAIIAQLYPFCFLKHETLDRFLCGDYYRIFQSGSSTGPLMKKEMGEGKIRAAF
ncbi:hypothetical protein F4813DRAFT_397277 [Daldinia decipiens]|uniref:uncharacterized protein n=1 Tax=Daldinia decipiens TaxID=326647 RepID=UPI0020C5A37D|nr:uncharacterized protein F4813DRAFT_397277 [Daldinia decipiens]KAI1656698.1 hypothetical protein F4813DRAFT_397277 [Daldinia decipiens]